MLDRVETGRVNNTTRPQPQEQPEAQIPARTETAAGANSKLGELRIAGLVNSANFEARYDPVRQAPPPPTPDEALPQIEALPRPASSSREKVVNPEIAQTLAEIYQDNALAFAHAASASNSPLW